MNIVSKLVTVTPHLVRAINDVSDIIITLVRAVIILMVPVILMFVLRVEVNRVIEGISLFDVHAARMAAWALVMSNLVLEMVIRYFEALNGYERENEFVWSLRIFYSNLKYFWGIGKKWEKKTLGPSHELIKVQNITTTTILLLALSGSMSSVWGKYEDYSWLEALIMMVTKSSLSEMWVIFSGLFFAFAAVRIAQVLTSYVSDRASDFSITLASQAGIKLNAVDVETTNFLEDLSVMVKSSKAADGVLRSGSGWADMESLVWNYEGSLKEYGPYKTKGTMAAAIRSVSRSI